MSFERDSEIARLFYQLGKVIAEIQAAWRYGFDKERSADTGSSEGPSVDEDRSPVVY